MIGRPYFRAALLGVGAAFVLALGPANAQDMKAEVEALKKRVAELESGTSVTVSGYVKGDLYLDTHDDLGRAFDPTSVRLDGAAGDDAEDGSFGAHAGQSRVRIGTSTDTAHGALKTVVEGHFFGGSAFTLRHAHGVLGPVLVGQAWSIIVDEDTFASTVDFNGPAGTNFTRQPQLRLSLPIGGGLIGQMAVEPGIEGNELPKFLAAVRYRAGWGAINAAGAMGRIDRNMAAKGAPADWQNENAYALHFGANFNVADGTQLVATLNATRGWDLIWGSANGASADASGDLTTRETMGGIAGASHSWSDTISTGIYFGWVENDSADAADPVNDAVQTVHANVFWKPVPAASVGFEVMHGRREVSDGSSGEATRLQIGVQYSF